MELFVLGFREGFSSFGRIAGAPVPEFDRWSLAAAVALLLGTQAYAVAPDWLYGETEPWEVWTCVGMTPVPGGCLLLCAFGISLLVRSSDHLKQSIESADGLGLFPLHVKITLCVTR